MVDMKPFKVCFIVCFMAVSLGCTFINKIISGSSAETRTAEETVTTCRSSIDGFRSLHNLSAIPDHLTSGEPYRKSGDFDPNRYFDVLTHLSMETGYTLDYVYYSNDLGGKPVLYARKTNAPAFKSYEEFLQSVASAPAGETKPYQARSPAYAFLQKVHTDESADGYFQFDVLSTLGAQFYLSWHAAYDDALVLCDIGDLAFVQKELDSFDVSLTDEQWKQARALDFHPTVSIHGDEINVRMMLFSKWVGFWERIYVHNQQDPFNLFDLRQNVMIPYDCGIMF
jgi:hypothetical protein